VTAQCGFYSHFSYVSWCIFSCAYWPFVCYLWRNRITVYRENLHWF
jgi:hypothetical protein